MYSRTGIVQVISLTLNAFAPAYYEILSPDIKIFPYENYVSIPDLSKYENIKDLKLFLRTADEMIEVFESKYREYLHEHWDSDKPLVQDSIVMECFADYVRIIEDPNDAQDCEIYYPPISPYMLGDEYDEEAYKEIIKKKDEELAKRHPDEILMKMISKQEQEMRKELIVVRAIDLNAARKNNDQQTRPALEYSEEQWLMHLEPMTFLLNIAIANWNDYEGRFKKLLTLCKMLPHEQSWDVYDSVAGIVTLMKAVQEYNAETGYIKEPFHFHDLSHLLSILASSSQINSKLIEDLIILSHGIIDETRLSSLASLFSLPPELIKAFFLNSFSRQEDMNELKSLLMLLIQRVYQMTGQSPSLEAMKETEEILMALVDIYNGEGKGWQTLFQYCASEIKNGKKIMKLLLNLMEWKGGEGEVKSMILGLKGSKSKGGPGRPQMAQPMKKKEEGKGKGKKEEGKKEEVKKEEGKKEEGKKEGGKREGIHLGDIKLKVEEEHKSIAPPPWEAIFDLIFENEEKKAGGELKQLSMNLIHLLTAWFQGDIK